MNGKRWWMVGAVVAALALVAAMVALFLTGRASAPMATVGPSSAPSPGQSTTALPPSSASPAPASSAPAPSATSTKGVAEAKLAELSLEQKVGQVLMVSSPVTGADANSLYALDTLIVGNVFVKGRSTAGQSAIAGQVSALTSHISGSRTAGILPFVATDQEGGLVQIMQGPGFDDMPQAIEQGQLSAAALQSQATEWGKQLSAVGVNVNLAPVMDTVPGAGFAPQNAPIGAFGREYGYTPAEVSSHGIAFAKGMQAGGIDPTIKHFPGLGRVTQNTDVEASVVDAVTVRNDAYVGPFRDAVKAGAPWLMISNASYPQIDPKKLAPFSPIIVHDMVRGDLEFKGIIVSDDICDAVQVAAVPVSERGVLFLKAGGTMALCTNQALLPQMYAGMLKTAQNDPGFAATLDAAALVVLKMKVDRGLVN
ncbi:beta-N-acetylhexosaminidase [Arthrobacter alpinus]|uniref:beta-N-acetylhexosaminidase n=1 Tax=Arthrobacter alpinus TaxID=656366 RepID=A0A1H5EEQ5_9MICC|nr:glycoside hydrolase family 3 N-terminal domain-containing protein [Arthrobacter alpinus]SED89579.1 beta-N-acetylhexosaminidase [Arthrobacter alpinus]